MVGSAVVMMVAGLVHLGGAHLAAPQPAARAAPPTFASTACPSTQLELTGAVTECVTFAGVEYCPQSFDQVKVVRLNGPKTDFLLYVEINGDYQGPGTYPLPVWPHPSLGVNDRVAKVALRDYVSGRLWESTAGSLTVDASGTGGRVSAGLWQRMDSLTSGTTPVPVDLNLNGWWTCS